MGSPAWMPGIRLCSPLKLDTITCIYHKPKHLSLKICPRFDSRKPMPTIFTCKDWPTAHLSSIQEFSWGSFFTVDINIYIYIYICICICMAESIFLHFLSSCSSKFSPSQLRFVFTVVHVDRCEQFGRQLKAAASDNMANCQLQDHPSEGTSPSFFALHNSM